MPVVKTIQWKALMLSIIFTANFSVVCHCSAHAAPMALRHSCCGNHRQDDTKGPDQRASHRSCDDKGGCPAIHAVKFNLLEKQVPSVVHAVPLFAALLTTHFIIIPEFLPTRSGDCPYLHKHPPPDLQALYQRFLI